MNKFTHRFIARIIIEAVSPLAVGNGEKSILTDSLVAKDVNGLPYIPGTSLTGVIRSLCTHLSDSESIFGSSGDKGAGSEIVFTEAKLLNKDGIAVDGILGEKDEFLSHFINLPIRQHVRIEDSGTAANAGKYDEEVVYRGARFCFEMEMLSDGSNFESFKTIIEAIRSPSFRLGGGTRNGFGEVKVIECIIRSLNLTKTTDLDFYLNKSSNLSIPWNGEKFNAGLHLKNSEYRMELKPEKFFIFGSGFGDKDADMTPAWENMISWSDGAAKIISCHIIPATSVKGAIRHRTLYHLNRLTGTFEDSPNADTEKNIQAVRCLFGYEGDLANDAIPGSVFVSDLSITGNKEKIFNHIKIDRFTSAPINGALFQEKVLFNDSLNIMIHLSINDNAVDTALGKCKLESEKENLIKAFELAMEDICKGLLPLGGYVNRGHGRFHGTLKKNGIEYSPEN